MTSPTAQGYGVKLNNQLFRVARSDETPARTYTQEALAGRQQQSNLPGRHLLDVGDSEIRDDLTGGEGLDRYPRQNPLMGSDLDITRYWSSTNMDFRRPKPGHPSGWTLSPKPGAWATVAAPIRQIISTIDELMVAAGDIVSVYSDPEDVGEVWTQDLGDPISMLATSDSGEAVALLDNGELWHRPMGIDEFFEIDHVDAPEDVIGVWVVKDRIVIYQRDLASAEAGKLAELSLAVGGTPTTPTYTPTVTVFDTFHAELRFVSDCGTVIMAGTSDGYLRSYVPRADTAGSPPLLTITGRTHIEGERPYALAHRSGRVIVLTEILGAIRLHTGTLLDERFNFVVGELQLRRTWEIPIPEVESPTWQFYDRISISDDNAWWMIDDVAGLHIWRYDLVSTGVHNHHTMLHFGGSNIVAWRGAYALHHGNLDVMVESEEFPEEGNVILPVISLGMNTEVAWQAIHSQVDDLVFSGGLQVQIMAAFDVPDVIFDPDNQQWQQILAATGPQQARRRTSLDVSSHTIAIMVKIRAVPPGFHAPKVRQIGIVGVSVERNWVVEVPISISDQAEVPYRQPLTVPGWGDSIHRTLMQMSGQPADITLFDPPVRVVGILNRVLEPTAYVTDRGSQGVRCIVEVLGKRIGLDTSSEDVADEASGLGLMGVMLLGVGQSGID